MEFNIQVLPMGEFSDEFRPSKVLFERSEKEVVAPHPCTTSFVDSMQRNGQAYTNNTHQSEQTFFNQDELTLYHMLFGDAQSNEAETLGSNRQAYTNITHQSEQTFFNQDELTLYHMLFGDAQSNEAETLGSNRQAYTNITNQSEQTSFNQDELTLYHMLFGDAQSNEAETLGSNRQAHTNIGDQSERYDQPFLDLDETNQDPASVVCKASK
jgi:general stress protein 26